MNIALPILLLVFGGLSFWILTESKVKWYVKTSCISVFCIFTVIFWTSIHTFLGWPASQKEMPEKALLHWVIIKEPNKATEFDGKIYVLLESSEIPDYNFLARFFGYSKDRIEPRLYSLEYNRQLHEKLAKGVMKKLRQGQPTMGKFEKKDGQKSGKAGEKGEPTKKGDGSESQKQEWHFHELLPSEIHRKPE